MPLQQEGGRMSFIAQLRECGLGTEPASGHLYLLAEASAHPGLIGHLEFQGASHLCLWHLEPGSGLEKHAPWLFQLTPDSALDTWLGSAHGGLGCTVIETDAAIAGTCAGSARSSRAKNAISCVWVTPDR
ncbi:DUF4123 domain-containing protein [Pseudomonas sp. L7]|uniref:DUF4123 domain-containing protein n=1 Tax=Pseudomonas sp. L7 TaxID=3388343 RepID=UPI0039847531